MAIKYTRFAPILLVVFTCKSFSTAAYADTISEEVSSIGNRFFMREEASDLLFSEHGDLGQSFQCSGGTGFVVNEAGSYNGICVVEQQVFSIEAITWPRTSELQAVTVCNHSVARPGHNIPIQSLRSAEIESSDWNVNGRIVGRVRYLGRTGGWLSDTYDNVLLDGSPMNIEAICWMVKKTKR